MKLVVLLLIVQLVFSLPPVSMNNLYAPRIKTNDLTTFTKIGGLDYYY